MTGPPDGEPTSGPANVTRPVAPGAVPLAGAPLSQRGDWDGVFTGKRPPVAEVSLRLAIKQSVNGGSGSFLGAADDGNRYWIKPLNNQQGARVCATEQIVGRIGRLIGAPTCDVRTVEIPALLAGWAFRPGSVLQPGIAHGSADTPNAIETHQLLKRQEDSNASRHAYVLGLYDLCWGGDEQWLMDANDEYRYYSHDHGWYLPPNGPTWDEASMRAELDTPHELADTIENIALEAVGTLVARLRALTLAEVVAALAAIPTGWAVTDVELETVGHFIHHRAPHVATRLGARFTKGRP